MPNYKTSFRAYSAWDYEHEIEDLNKASEQGWQLVKGGAFHSRFEENPDVRYRYQIDFGKVDNIGRYIETFREQGWEYINSTFNGWHYFRKAYDPDLPEEAYEIYSDRQSLSEMQRRWARFAMIMGIIILAFAVVFGIRAFRQLNWPNAIQFLVLFIESIVLIRGAAIMRSPDTSKNRRGGNAFITAFLVIIIVGAVSIITLGSIRPSFTTSQRTASMDSPKVDDRWLDFDVKYPDNYYLDLELTAEKPVTVKIVGDDGNVVYTQTSADYKEDDIRVRLSRGHYWLLLSAESGFDVECKLH